MNNELNFKGNALDEKSYVEGNSILECTQLCVNTPRLQDKSQELLELQESMSLQVQEIQARLFGGLPGEDIKEWKCDNAVDMESSLNRLIQISRVTRNTLTNILERL